MGSPACSSAAPRPRPLAPLEATRLPMATLGFIATPGGESPCLKTRSYQHHLSPPRSPSQGTAGSVPEATRDAEGDVDGLRFRDEAEVAAFYEFYQQEVRV